MTNTVVGFFFQIHRQLVNHRPNKSMEPDEYGQLRPVRLGGDTLTTPQNECMSK